MKNPNCPVFVFCPCCGEKSLVPESHKSFGCRSCGFIFYINNAAAVMALIFNEKKELLVTLRKNDPAKGQLDLPGGFAEPGEGIEQSLIREVKEELNLEITSLRYLCSFSNTYPFKGVIYPITDMAFICETSGLENIRARDDVLDFQFVDPAALDTTSFGMESPRRVVETWRRIHLYKSG
ncbi:NUDIX hydrolase [Desulfospira joergensenii]|uniref:NUDIX hydrolase n=1 Tax=Desulfospira joergensenii TaxID=53329 RepID=UPI0003B4044F|nr:NUDIX domain-containing protein [Desulfospira joergensenii]